MYDFIDVNEASKDVFLPSEALKFNGEYLENQIAGYRTLHVSGREALSPELSCYETGARDGSIYQNKRYPSRIITVTYSLKSASSSIFREAFNRLGQLLDKEGAEMIFNDEPDKFFKGTLSAIGAVEPGTNSVVGELEFLCTDPLKYSVVEYEAVALPTDPNLLVDYNGTYRAYPLLEAKFYQEEEAVDNGETAQPLTGAGDCGFVAFLNEKEKIIQLGNPNEEDGNNPYKKSQTLVNQTFTEPTAWGAAAKKQWIVNSLEKLSPDVKQTGNIGMGVASYSVPSVPTATSATILHNAKSLMSAPTFYYTIVAKAYSRTESTTTVSLAVTTSLGSSGSYFGYGYGLDGYVYIGGAWRKIVIKETDEWWEGKSGHLVSMTLTVRGLAAGTTAISGIKFKATRSDSVGGAAGILDDTACGSLPVSRYSVSAPETYYLAASDYGTAGGKYHGPSITRCIPGDESGEVGAANFTFTYQQKLCISGKGTNQLGAFQVQLLRTDGKIVAGIRIVKNKTGKNGSLVFYLNDKVIYTDTIDLSYNNPYFGATKSAVKTSTITKSGDRVVFSIGGIKKAFAESNIESDKVQRVIFVFEQYSTLPPFSHNGLYWAKFIKNNCNTYQDIPNKFSANDVVTADCKNGEIRLNGVPSPGLGALGNDWEEFQLVPGLNQLGVVYSAWVTDKYAPSFKVRYREVFL
ncbi:MAG: phage tail family protein [Oscillospiraceae bacterium]